MKKNVLIKWSSLIFILFMVFILYFKTRKCVEKTDLSTVVYDKLENHFLVQDSLIIEIDSIKKAIYQGYTKNVSDTLKWDDIIKIYHIRSNDTILRNEITFLRQENEGSILLMDNSLIPDEIVDKNSFIMQTAISNKGNFSENTFTFNQERNEYEFIKRINYMDYLNKDTLGVKTVFFIKNRININAKEMNSIFKRENDIFNGIKYTNSEWVVKKNRCTLTAGRVNTFIDRTTYKKD